MPYPKLLVMVSFSWKMNFLPSNIKIKFVLLTMSLKLTIKVVAFFLGHPVLTYLIVIQWLSKHTWTDTTTHMHKHKIMIKQMCALSEILLYTYHEYLLLFSLKHGQLTTWNNINFFPCRIINIIYLMYKLFTVPLTTFYSPFIYERCKYSLTLLIYTY